MARMSNPETFARLRDELKSQLERKRIEFVPSQTSGEGSEPEPTLFYHDGQALDFFCFKQREVERLYDASQGLYENQNIVSREEFILGVCGEANGGTHTSAKILATLINIGVPADSAAWYRLLSTPVDKGFCDNLLPFSVYKAEAHFGKEWFLKFHHEQLRFCPLILEDGGNKTIARSDSQRPLPYVKEEYIGNGQFGTVYRVKLAKGSGLSQPEVARKDIQPSFANEWLIAERLQQGSVDHKHIVKSIARLNHLDSVSIFMELADCDLEHHMEVESPEGPEAYLKQRMLQNMAKIAGALDYLHTSLRDDEGQPLTFIHLDLKPKNILVVYDRNKSDLTLKVADFSISCMKHKTRRSDNGSYRLSYTNTGVDHANSCVAPEGLVQDGPIDVKCDVWSFGCVLAIFVAWVQGGWAEVERFRRLRYEAGASEDRSTDGFAVIHLGRLLDRNAKSWKASNGTKYKLNAGVKCWFDSIQEDTEIATRLRGVWDMLRTNVLVPSPADRKSMAIVLKQLEDHASKPIKYGKRPSDTPKRPSDTPKRQSSSSTTDTTSSGAGANDIPPFRLPVNAGDIGVRACVVSQDGHHVAHVCDNAIFYAHIDPLLPQRQPTTHFVLKTEKFCHGAKWAFCRFNKEFLFAVPQVRTSRRFKLLIFPLASFQTGSSIHAFEVDDDVDCKLELLATHPSDPFSIGCAVTSASKNFLIAFKLEKLRDIMSTFESSPDSAHVRNRLIRCFESSDHILQHRLNSSDHGLDHSLKDLKFSSNGELLFLAHVGGQRSISISSWSVSTKASQACNSLKLKDEDGRELFGELLAPLTTTVDNAVVVLVQECFVYCWNPHTTVRLETKPGSKTVTKYSPKIALTCFDMHRSCVYFIGQRKQGKTELGVYSVPLDRGGVLESTNLGPELAKTTKIHFDRIRSQPFCATVLPQADTFAAPRLLLADYTGNVELLTLPLPEENHAHIGS